MTVVKVAGGSSGLGRTIIDGMKVSLIQKFHPAAVSALQLGQTKRLPGHKAIYDFWSKREFQWVQSQLGVWFEGGLFDLKPTQTSNDTFPEIESMRVGDFLQKCLRAA